MKVNFLANWYKDIQTNIPRGILALKINEKDIQKVAIILKKLNEYQHTKNILKDLEISLDVNYKKRSLDQNKLMFALYAVLANEFNGDHIGEHALTPVQLYEQDLINFGLRMELKVPEQNVNIVKSLYRIVEEEKPLKDGMIYLKVIITSSHFNTKQMTQWIEMLFNRLAEMGLTFENSAKIKDYWDKWQNRKNKEKIKIDNDKNTIQEYKNSHINCEACSRFIGGDMELGNLAHIKSVGSGGKNKATNFLHLCGNCHIEIQHQKGWTFFCSKYPHLKNKIENALIDGALDLAHENID